jgi:hypothetical protein
MLNNTLTFVADLAADDLAVPGPGEADPISQSVLDTARLPRPFEGLRVDAGIVLALLVALWSCGCSTARRSASS